MTCKYCRWWDYGHNSNECTNVNCEWFGENCIEKDKKEPKKCKWMTPKIIEIKKHRFSKEQFK